MKSFTKKTQEEIEAETTESYIKCSDYKDKYGHAINEWWSCDDCHVVFEPGDMVILKKKESGMELACPREKKVLLKSLFSKKWKYQKCKNHLYGGSAEWYKKNYKIGGYPINE